MSAERFDELLSAHLDGRLSPAEENELLQLLENRELQRKFLELARIDRDLPRTLELSLPDEKMALLVQQEIQRQNEGRSSGRASRILQSLKQESPPPRKRLGRVVEALAASVLFCLLAYVFMRPHPDGLTPLTPASDGQAVPPKPTENGVTALDEIVIRPSAGKAIGTEWALVKDADAVTGQAWEVTGDATAQKDRIKKFPDVPQYVEFTFEAEADKEYNIWVRGYSKSYHNDSLIIEFPDAECVRPCPIFVRLRENAFHFNGWGTAPAYWWVGGNADGDPPQDLQPFAVRFPGKGPHTIKLYGLETPMRVDLIWLSTSQTERPRARTLGPAPAKTLEKDGF